MRESLGCAGAAPVRFRAKGERAGGLGGLAPLVDIGLLKRIERIACLRCDLPRIFCSGGASVKAPRPPARRLLARVRRRAARPVADRAPPAAIANDENRAAPVSARRRKPNHNRPPSPDGSIR
ncbi:hypothetical protein X946_3757 [Burkholderia sp. ABCPW 111]|nr:hypothetical protein X946_3757 [Burkholderia sp. ABCPW 111]